MSQPLTTMGNISEPTTLAESTTGLQKHRRVIIYCLVNFLFLVLLFILKLFEARVGHDPLPFLFLIFALCTFPLIMVKEPNGSYCLLVVACPLMFLYFGANDLLSYFLELHGRYVSLENTLFTHAELVILSGVAALFSGYAVAVKVLGKLKSKPFSVDWKTVNTVMLGIVCVAVGLYATYLVQISVDYQQKINFGGNYSAAFKIFSRMLEPFGAVLLSYAYIKTRSFNLLLLILAIIAVKLPIGIILNSKEIGVSFLATFVVTKWIYDGKIPLRWIAISALVVVFYFPMSYAYREALQSKSFSVLKSLKSIETLAEKTMKIREKAKKPFDGLDKFIGRNDFKTILELTVNRTGKDVPFQNGKTLAALPYVFIPRLIMPNKPEVSVGQIFNQQFKISASKETYISTTFLGEFYWNFGLFGALAGMFGTGLIWGGVGCLANVKEKPSVTRMLILISAIYTLILKFETGIAQQHILFIRSCLIIFVLHLIFKNRQAAAESIRVSGA
jgi:hypothetical protein